ncbi:MAG: hypothetical protein ACE5OS_13725 [Anaerolineae bacterium]
MQFVPLVPGHRTVDQLRAAYADVSVAPTWRLLLDTLLPKATSFIYAIY